MKYIVPFILILMTTTSSLARGVYYDINDFIPGSKEVTFKLPQHLSGLKTSYLNTKIPGVDIFRFTDEALCHHDRCITVLRFNKNKAIFYAPSNVFISDSLLANAGISITFCTAENTSCVQANIYDDGIVLLSE